MVQAGKPMRLLADMPLGRKLLGGFSIVLLLLLGLSAAAYWTTAGNVQASTSVEHTLQVIALAEATQGDLVDMETGYRGFLLTGQEQFLEPYTAGLASYPERLRQLEELTADNPVQVARWRTIDKLTQQWTQEFTEPRIQLRRQVPDGAQPSPELVALVSEGGGRSQFAAIRQVFDQAIATEQGLLAMRLDQAEAANERLFATLLIGTAVALLVGVSAALLLTRDITGAVDRLAAAATAVAAGDLTRRVRLDRRDEVGQAAEAFDHMTDRLQVTIVELENSSAELVRKQVELERSNRELQDFASVASHDLQEPLRKVRAFGDRLSAKYGPELTDQGRDYLGRMQDAAARMQALINDLLTFSRVATRAQPFVPVDLNSLVRQVVSDLEVRIQQSDATLEIEPLPTIDADPLQMRQLFQNLLANALKFQQPDVPPTVRVYAQDAGETDVQVCVQDDGIGFDEKYLDRIFTIFQRLHGRVDYEGTGVGLAVCRKIVERHSGTITAHSAPGEGATFIVTLPRSQPEPIEVTTGLAEHELEEVA
jgi:signal transduction histidine kinase